jgi:hypothetical protein
MRTATAHRLASGDVVCIPHRALQSTQEGSNFANLSKLYRSLLSWRRTPCYPRSSRLTPMSTRAWVRYISSRTSVQRFENRVREQIDLWVQVPASLTVLPTLRDTPPVVLGIPSWRLKRPCSMSCAGVAAVRVRAHCNLRA